MSGWNASKVFFIILCIGAGFFSPIHAEIIYRQDFPESSLSPLDGEAPVGSQSGSWSVVTTNGGIPTTERGIPRDEGQTGWFANGTYKGTASANLAIAYLPFTPEAGKIYTMSVALMQIGGIPGSGGWLGFGFAAAADGLTGSLGPWMMKNSNGPEGTTFRNTAAGSGGNAESFAAPLNFPITLKIVLDTSQPYWTATYYSETLLRTVTYDAAHPNPTVNYIALAGYKGVVFRVNNFQLSVENSPPKS